MVTLHADVMAAFINSNQYLDTLIANIISNVAIVKSEYARQNATVPSINSTEASVFDKDESNLQLFKATRMLVSLCDDLKDTVRNPSRSMIDRMQGFYEQACLRVVLERNVPSHLKEAGEGGLHAAVLAKKVDVEPFKLERILRYLTSKNIFREISPGVFTNNRLSITLDGEDGVGPAVLHCAKFQMKAANEFSDLLRHPVYGLPSILRMRLCLELITLLLGRIYLLFGRKTSHPEVLTNFARMMTGISKTLSGIGHVSCYPWVRLPKDTCVVDVAGGLGHAMMEVYEKHPHLQFVIQDLPGPVEDAPAVWASQCPGALKDNRVRFKAFDFFKDSPHKGADIYYIRYIIHNWPDEEAVLILKNVRQAMKTGSKVLLQELNLGKAALQENIADNKCTPPTIFAYTLDITVLWMLNACERSLRQYEALGKCAGLKLTEVYPTGEHSIMEFETM